MDGPQSEELVRLNMKKIYKTCKNCNKEIFSKSNFFRHKKFCKSNDDNINEVKDPFNVCVCGKDCMTRWSYFKHRKICEMAISQKAKKDQNNQPKFICLEDSCSFSSVHQADFLKHLKDIHSIEGKKEVKVFENRAEFDEWKEDFEAKTKSYYTLKNTKAKLNETLKYYICNRSGSYASRSKGKRSNRSQGSSKIGFKCPARIQVYVKDISQNITATIYPLHYGHDNVLTYLRIPKSERMSIAYQLSLGVEPTQILNNKVGIHPNKLERQHLTTRKDLRNISKAFGLGKVEYRSKGHLSVDAYVDENLQNEKSIFLYKRQGESFLYHPKDENCILEKEDFSLGIMTEFQCKMLHMFGNNVVCIDATHNTKNYDFQLITILTMDEFKDGIPVAWLICNKENSSALELFLTLLKRQIGNLSPKFLITNKAPEYYNGWIGVFPGLPKKLLCHWHIHQDWLKNLNSIENKEASSYLYIGLCKLIEETNEKEFNDLLKYCLLKMKENSDTIEFATYFESEWVYIKEEWAKCYRVGCEIRTSMYLESIRKSLKFGNKDFIGIPGKKVDKCLLILLQLSKDLPIKKLLKTEKRITDINNHHRKSFDLPFSLVKKISPFAWEVHSEFSSASESADKLLFRVTKERKCKKNCVIKCQHCNICVHDYSCDCPDGALKTNICEHVHLIVRFLNDDSCSEDETSVNNLYGETSSEEDAFDGKDVFQQLNSKNKTDLTELKRILIAKINALSKMVKKCENEDLLLSVGSHVDSSILILDLQTKNET